MMECQSDRAVILSNCGVVENSLTYGDVWKIRDTIREFLAKFVEARHVCVGLKMSHNVYIPSLILSLQELQLPFIFLPKEVVETELVIKELGIEWVLSFEVDDPQNGVVSINLDDCQLFLRKLDGITSKSYENIFYVVRTSGTTGQNKFVRVSKYSIDSNIVSLSKIFKICSKDVIYFGTPLTFDPSMVELLLAIRNKACLLITNTKTKLNSDRLHQTLFHPLNGITVLQIVPSLFMRWSQQQITTIFSNSQLKILAFGGEQFPQSILKYERSTNLRIFNLYGITEVSCWATIHEVTSSDEAIPIGVALDDTIVELREGEIYIGSHKRICWVDNETSLENPLFRSTSDLGVVINNQIFYQGRKNDTFKRWGHKIHLSKIEDSIRQLTSFENKCIWYKNSKLLLFLIDHNIVNKDKVIDKIRVKLLHSLPRHYFPDYIDFIRKYPLTVHGKVDTKVLEALYLTRDKSDMRNCSDYFKLLICKYFGLGQCLDDWLELTFFDVGGNSILAIQLLQELRDEFGVESPELTTALFEKKLGACLEYLKCVKTTKRPTEQSEAAVKKLRRSKIQLKIAWSFDMYACVDSSPLVFEFGNRVLVAVGSFSHIFAVIDGQTGEVVSKFVFPDVIEASPCLSPCQNFLFVGCFDGTMYCFDWQNSQIKWEYPTNDRIKCKPVLCQGSKSIVFGSYDKHIHCIHIRDGTPIWKTFTSESLISAPHVIDDKIFIATICGTCLCLSENGEVVWKWSYSAPVFGSPCYFNNSIIWPSVFGKVTSLSSDGEMQWCYDCGGHVYSSLLLYKDSIIFGSHDQHLYFLNAKDGSEIMKTHLGDKISNGVAVNTEKGCVVVASDNGRVFVVDFKGVVVGEMTLPNQIYSSAAVWKDLIFIGCRDDNLYCIKCF